MMMMMIYGVPFEARARMRIFRVRVRVYGSAKRARLSNRYGAHVCTKFDTPPSRRRVVNKCCAISKFSSSPLLGGIFFINQYKSRAQNVACVCVLVRTIHRGVVYGCFASCLCVCVQEYALTQFSGQPRGRTQFSPR